MRSKHAHSFDNIQTDNSAFLVLFQVLLIFRYDFIDFSIKLEPDFNKFSNLGLLDIRVKHVLF